MSKFDSSTEQFINRHRNTIAESTEAILSAKEESRASNARRQRNIDRAAVIVSRLMFEGMIEIVPGAVDNGMVFENSIDIVLDMLERYQLDSPEGEIVDVFSKISGDR